MWCRRPSAADDATPEPMIRSRGRGDVDRAGHGPGGGGRRRPGQAGPVASPRRPRRASVRRRQQHAQRRVRAPGLPLGMAPPADLGRPPLAHRRHGLPRPATCSCRSAAPVEIRFGRFVWIGHGTQDPLPRGRSSRSAPKTVIGPGVHDLRLPARVDRRAVRDRRPGRCSSTSTTASSRSSGRSAQQGIYKRDVVVGSNVWIGYGACILRGVSVGDNAIIGTNSVVTRDVPANAVVGRRPGPGDPHALRAGAHDVARAGRAGGLRPGGAALVGPSGSRPRGGIPRRGPVPYPASSGPRGPIARRHCRDRSRRPARDVRRRPVAPAVRPGRAPRPRPPVVEPLRPARRPRPFPCRRRYAGGRLLAVLGRHVAAIVTLPRLGPVPGTDGDGDDDQQHDGRDNDDQCGTHESLTPARVRRGPTQRRSCEPS